MEKYLEVGGRVLKVVSYQTAEQGLTPSNGFPAALAAVLPLHERASSSRRDQDIGVALDSVAEELWERLCVQAEALAEQTGAAAWRDPARLPPWGLVKLMAVVVASGSTYAGPALRDADDDSPRWAANLEAARMILSSSVQLLLKDTRKLSWLVAQTLSGRGLRVLCRHYAAALQALFYAAKRARALHPRVHVVSVFGRADFSHPMGHAWNWYVDSRMREVVALDLTGADWLLDRGQAESILNRGFDGARWNNISCFLVTLFLGFGSTGSPLYERHEVTALIAALVDPSTLRGQALLFRLAQQPMLGGGARSRIVERLHSEGFGRAFLDWRTDLVLRGLFGGMTSRIVNMTEPRLDMALLDAIGV